MHYITVGRKTEAYGLAERAVELAPQDSLTNGNLAALLLADAISEDAASGKLAQAVAYFQKSVALDAANLPAHKGLGYALMKSGRFTEAEQQLLPVLQTAPQDANALYALGMVRAGQERWDEAPRLPGSAPCVPSPRISTRIAHWRTCWRSSVGPTKPTRNATPRRTWRRRAAVLTELGERYLANGHLEQRWPHFAGRCTWILATRPAGGARPRRRYSSGDAAP